MHSPGNGMRFRLNINLKTKRNVLFGFGIRFRAQKRVSHISTAENMTGHHLDRVHQDKLHILTAAFHHRKSSNKIKFGHCLVGGVERASQLQKRGDILYEGLRCKLLPQLSVERDRCNLQTRMHRPCSLHRGSSDENSKTKYILK